MVFQNISNGFCWKILTRKIEHGQQGGIGSKSKNPGLFFFLFSSYEYDSSTQDNYNVNKCNITHAYSYPYIHKQSISTVLQLQPLEHKGKCRASQTNVNGLVELQLHVLGLWFFLTSTNFHIQIGHHIFCKLFFQKKKKNFVNSIGFT
jgi:hypothetical protein